MEAQINQSAQKPAGPRPYKRSVRNIFIHKPMQREFTFVLVSLLIVSSLAITFVIHYTLQGAAGGGGYQFGRISPYEILSDVSYLLIVRVAAILFVTLVVLGTFGIFFLHRVAGPVYRFRQVFMKLNRGEIPYPLRIREGDFFHETAEEINRLMKHFQYDQQKARLIHDKLDQIIASHPSEAVVRSAKELKSIVDSRSGE